MCLYIQRIFVLLCALYSLALPAQPNAWIDFNKTYYKFRISEDGIYRIDAATLEAAGLPLAEIQGSDFRLYCMGQEVMVYTSTATAFQPSDYIEFFGKKNRGEFDRFLFRDPDAQQLNPEYSMFSDHAAYYLTWDNAITGMRYVDLENDLSELPAPETHYLHTDTYGFSDILSDPRINNDGISYARFEEGEGFGSTNRANSTVAMAASRIFPDGPDASLHVRFVTNVLTPEVHVYDLLFNNTVYTQSQASNIEIVDAAFQVPASVLKANNSLKITRQNDVSRHILALVEFTYPRQFFFADDSLAVLAIDSSAERTYIKAAGFNVEGGVPVLYDLTHGLRVQGDVDPEKYVEIALPPGSDRELILVNSAHGISPVSDLELVNFRDFTDDDPEYIIITHPDLRTSADETDWVEAYATYRSGQDGGQYQTGIYNIGDLYDQFSFGIEKHPLAIRFFADFAEQNWPSARFFLIIGKAIEYHRSRVEDGSWEEGFFVPTYGRPGSDNLLFATPENPVPRFAIGRLPVINGEEVRIYLDKVKKHDQVYALPQTVEDKAWTKNILHLGGGREVDQQDQIKNDLDQMGSILESGIFGANLHTFTKQSTNTIGESQTAQILNIIQEGTTLVKFFGHSGASTLDFQINSPSEWHNSGKFPIFSAMGCSAGQVHSTFRSLSEIFVFEEDAGSIAFVAGSGGQYQLALSFWGKNWYNQFGRDHYGITLGESLLKSYQYLSQFGTFIYEILLEQQTLNGDPAVLFHPHPGPDYIADRERISISPGIINTQVDSIEVGFEIKNLGSSQEDSLTLLFSHALPDGSRYEMGSTRISAPGFSMQGSLTLPIQAERAAGLNTLFLEVDAGEDISELPLPEAEFNNTLRRQNGEEGIGFFVISNDIVPVSPDDFAIVNTGDITFYAATSNPLTGLANYLFEIDTTALFNSPVKRRFEKSQPGGLLSFQPDITYEDNTVYYWRVSPDSTDDAGLSWRSHSFVYLDNADRGFNQSHYYQFLADDFSQIAYGTGENPRQFTFEKNYLDLTIRNHAFEPGRAPALFIGSTTMIYWAWDAPVTRGLQVAVFDPFSLEYLRNQPNGLYGSHLPDVPNVVDHANFPFWTDTEANRETLIDFLENQVPDSSYVVVWSITRLDTEGGYLPENWALDSATNQFGKNLFQVFEEQGASQMRTVAMTGAVPFVLIYKKNDSSYSPIEAVASTEDETIELNFNFEGRADQGTIRSVQVGPASQWDRLIYDLNTFSPGTDSAALTITGITPAGEMETLAEGISGANYDLTAISADAYPELILQLHLSDALERTIPQLGYWRVFYEGLPDVVLNRDRGLDVTADTLFRGQEYRLAIAAENYTVYDMDSLLVKFTVLNAKNVEQTFYRTFAPLKGGQHLIVDFKLSTSDLDKGDHLVFIELNPGKAQPERNYTNNSGTVRFFLRNDEINPLLDVTFDGIHIMDGDLVSSRPNIQIVINDENKYLPLRDTGLFSLSLTDPDGTTTAISMNDPRVMFQPASLDDLPQRNEARIMFTPEFLLDGVYQLRVQASDESGNISGDLDYSIGFEVITASKITNVFNYPNPFSTATRFVYTLTGDTPPQHFKIQILTASGKVVREITELEIGPLLIGTHITDYVWDGTDEYGDKLANGVYLYRVIAKDAEGQAFEKLSLDQDVLFRKDFGKMVIIR